MPLASVAVSVIAVTPTPDTVVPDIGDCVTDITPEQLSLVIASDV